MKTIEIVGANAYETRTEHRTACRGIVVNGEMILLSYEEKTDLYMIPGGGLEGQETAKECCQREISEETGILVSADEQYLTMNEFYEQWCYETHFFICRGIGETERKLTDREQKVGMVPRWVNMNEALGIFSRHQEYAETGEEKRGIYLREYLALTEYVNRKSSANPCQIH